MSDFEDIGHVIEILCELGITVEVRAIANEFRVSLYRDADVVSMFVDVCAHGASVRGALYAAVAKMSSAAKAGVNLP